MLLGETGTLALESEVLMIEARTNRYAGKIAERLAKANVNIEYAYLAASPKAGKRTDDSASVQSRKAQRALRDL